MPTRTASRRPDDATRTVADNLARQIIHASGLTIARGPLDVYLNAYVATGKWRIPKASFKREVAAALRRRGAKITSKANTAPVRTELAEHRRSLALRSGKTGRTPKSTVASRLASMSPRKRTTKASPKSTEMKRRRASLTPAERSALAAARERDPRGWKTALSRAGRDGNLRGHLASAFAKLGAGGVFAYPVKG